MCVYADEFKRTKGCMEEFDFEAFDAIERSARRKRLAGLTLLAEIGTNSVIATEERLIAETKQLLEELNSKNSTA